MFDSLKDNPRAPVAVLRRELGQKGYSPVPIRNGEKAPFYVDWPERARAGEFVAGHIDPDFQSTGLECSGLRPIDIDCDQEEIAAQVAILAGEILGPPGAVRFRDDSSRLLFLYRSTEGAPGKRRVSRPRAIKTEPSAAVEVLGAGQQFVADGFHPSGARYQWDCPLPPRDDLPAITEEQIGRLLAAVAPILGAPPEGGGGGGQRVVHLGEARSADGGGGKARDPAALAAIVRALPNGPAFDDRPAWIGLAHALAGALGDGLGRELFLEHAAKREQEPGAPEKVWDTLQPPHLGGEHHLLLLARAAGIDTRAYEAAKAAEAFTAAGALPVDPGAPALPLPPAFSEDRLALRFTATHADLRYVHAWGKWFRYDGTRWVQDSTLSVYDMARKVCREAAAECNDPRVAPHIAAAKTVAAVERMARGDRRHAATVEQWDPDPWLLNTPGGVVDLRTGTMRPHRPEDYMTKITAASPGGECPLWHAFLAKITAGDTEMQNYLQRVAGYCLTGITTEHALFFGYGTGGNGKGVFLNTLTAIWAGYATTASMATFTASTSDRHPTDLAMLRGARLVAAQETEEGRRWDESRVKSLTGGDPITARFMHQDFFTFLPAFKLFIAGNHKPGLRTVDEAMRRRLHLIPFTVTIPPAERDQNLAEKLRAEWPGILAWAVGGCLEWQRIGLAPPAAVKNATADYLEAEDSIAAWIAERCIVSTFATAPAGLLFTGWQAWATAAGEHAGNQKQFGQALEARGFIPTRLHGGIRAFKGISIKAAEPVGQIG